jgi:CDP-glucose 4,6-dehydratase
MAVFAITGATGLLGSNLANNLISNGHSVYALVKDEQSRSFLSRDANRVFGNINSKSDLEYFIQKSNPDYFVHLAAQTQAYDSLKYPYQTFYNNFVGTLNVLECLREFDNCSKILIASSDKAYGELIGKSYTEDHPLKGIYPYDASKSAADLLSYSYRMTYNLPIFITRACNIYGNGDYNRQRLIPGIVDTFINNGTFTIRNEGKDLREYIHVDDVVTAYKKILELDNSKIMNPAFNISSGDRYTTMEIFKLVENAIGSKIESVVSNFQGFEIKKQFMDSTYLQSTTDWLPEKKLEKEIDKIVAWYKENLV